MTLLNIIATIFPIGLVAIGLYMRFAHCQLRGPAGSIMFGFTLYILVNVISRIGFYTDLWPANSGLILQSIAGLIIFGVLLPEANRHHVHTKASEVYRVTHRLRPSRGELP